MTGDSLPFLQMVFAALSDVAFACALGGMLLGAWLSRERVAAAVSPAQRGWRRASHVGMAAALAFVLCGFVSLWLESAR